MTNRALRTALVLLPLALGILVAGAMALFEQAKLREEQAIYALLLIPQPEDSRKMWQDVAYLSAPVVCEAPPALSELPGLAELYASYVEANSVHSRPVSMEKLEGRVPVVSGKSAQQVHRAGGLGMVSADSRRLVGVSRVGFSNFLDEALLCVHGEGFPHSNGYLLRYVRSGDSWEFAGWWYSNRIK